MLDFLKNILAAKSVHAEPAAHMTWASRTMSKTALRTKDFLGKRLWIWPIIALLLFSLLGWVVHGSIERTMESSLRSSLEGLLKVEAAMIDNWLAGQKRTANRLAGDTEVRQLTAELLALPPGAHTSDETKDLAERLKAQFVPALNSHDYGAFFIADQTTILASSQPEAVGMKLPLKNADVLERLFDGEACVLPPFPSVLPQVDHTGQRRTGVPVMFVLAPILDQHLQVTAVLGLLINPEQTFTRLLQLGTVGDSGETLAFNRDGLMLSNSRFTEDLVLLRLIEDRPEPTSILQLSLRDPGGDMRRGFSPKVRHSELPLTRMVQSAVQGESGTDLQGYRDYRGVPVVGSWTWLENYGFGLATEVDHAEAFRPLTILKRTFWGLLGLLALSSLAIFAFTVAVARLQRQARDAAIEARQLGQYTLEEKLGEGSMGVVYRGRHAMLRRPTAIKLLNADKVSDQSISRFEREVQITSHLNHPNTVAIYDYGRTPEDIFYYAMEYLDGIDLQQLVEQYGPQPAGRVIYILRQVCGSLYEAHSKGLVHRDIKPANIMLNRRGNEGDVVKVLDFGLVKARGKEFGEEAAHEGIAGTPLYMSPEAIQLPGSVDACSDLYAVGAVGYFLLTGHSVFEAETLSKLCQLHTAEQPLPPSARLGKPVPAELENAILNCLAKDRSKRPQTARDLAHQLATCPAASEWSLEQADAWWSHHERGERPAAAAPLVSGATNSGGFDETILHSS